MPRKRREKLLKEPIDDTSEAAQSDRYSLPPPPDEFTSYRPGPRVTTKEALRPATSRKDDADDDPRNPFNEVIISPMNTVGLPIVGQNSLYTYPDDETQVRCYENVYFFFHYSLSNKV